MSGWHGRRLEANQSALEHALEDLKGDASYEPIAPSLWATQGDLRPRLRRATKWHACSLLFCFVAFSFREQIATFSAIVSRLAGMDWAKGKRQTRLREHRRDNDVVKHQRLMSFADDVLGRTTADADTDD